ncbi:MAG: hypothetical protein IKL56_02060 [Bacteroidaceae bacterium]|nr:hypothetical protein [Bacteroidaceae bacterium]
MYYYGIKLHLVGQKRKRALPFPEIITLTDAAENDLTAFKRECMLYILSPKKTEIQRASKARATKGVLVHIFGKLAIALLVFANL